MTEREIRELAAILVVEHGGAAINVAETRRAEHAREQASDGFRLWTAIAEAAVQLLAKHDRKNRPN